tara:strand:- start:1226 stop:2080 length:855 start_codon:yes stop_codon:yes gene_type:complete
MKFLNEFISCLCLSVSILGFSQTSLNDYKYVSVPENYNFLKQKDQYQLNSLSVFLFEKNNFTVLNSLKNYPSDLAQNSCLLLNSDVIKINGFFKTKLQLVLTDCRDNIVFSSEIGQSKLKDYKKAFQEALRNAFVSISDLNYAYSGSATSAKPLLLPVIAAETYETQTLQLTAPLVPEPPIIASNSNPELESILVSPTPVAVPPFRSTENSEVLSGLIVKVTVFGFDFIDNINKKVKYSAQATMFKNVYIIEGQSGIIYKRGAAWVREYYEQNKTIIETLNTLP